MAAYQGTYTFDDVIGLEDAKELIRSGVIDQARHTDLHERYSPRSCTSILLFGLPGTGKTTLALAVANEIGAPMHTPMTADYFSKMRCKPEECLRQLFLTVRSQPIPLLFFDELDVLGCQRNERTSPFIGELINQMTSFRKSNTTSLLVAATSKPWMLDSGLTSPDGPFEHQIYIPLPHHDARIMLVKKHLGDGVPVDPMLDMHRVSDLLKGYNGADIVSVVKSAKCAALARVKKSIALYGQACDSPVTFEDFYNAATNHKTSVDPKDIVQLRRYAAERGIKLPEEM